MKKNLFLPFGVIISLLMITLSGCGKKDKIKIGFLYNSEVTFRFFLEGNFFKEHAEALGAQVILDHANNNDALQYDKAIEMMDQDIDLLVLVAVNINTAENIVKEAKAQNIPVMAYNRLISNCDLDIYISGNNDQLGKDLIGYVIKQKPKGNYIILNGDRFDRNAVELMTSIDKTLKPHIESGNINVLYKTYIENWNPEHAAFELDQILSVYPQSVDAVISCFDGMSVSCVDVLKKYGLDGKVIVTGQDAQIESCRRIVEGTQHLTLYHPLKDIAYKAAEVAIDIVNGVKLEKKYNITYVNNGFEDVPTVQINSIPVTKENIDEVLIESGFYKREEIYQ
ncbi:substrate-binding domain-containing protein [Thermophagus xiamenensis]|uniref:D-xylose transport system substrate-binding protein n=1 Tax=Thermophagus xiamenensis TaxID=385682 RepID=A0A1I2EUE4_9BACT|nr:substrate-binding domain-containing protein [Thermophagus xiamenensis]SFE95840.1 D-xylose transport system substrate-binding protein [Thermophagus xiamenensis]